MSDQVLEVHLPQEDTAFEEYQALEVRVGEELEASDLGYLDGNDVGQGEFTLFLFGPDARALLTWVQPRIPAGLLHPGAHAVLRVEEDEETVETTISLAGPIAVEAPPPWKPLSFGQYTGGETAETRAFDDVLKPIWRSLPEQPPSSERAARLIVIWQLEGRFPMAFKAEMSVKVEGRDERTLGATVPIPQRPRSEEESLELIRGSLAAALDTCRALIARKGLDWDLVDVEAMVGRI